MATKEERKYEVSLKEEKFICEYLKTGNASEAARRAGYSGSAVGVTASKLKRKLAKEIARAQEARSDRMHLEEDFELRKAVQVLDLCMEPKKVRTMFGELKDEDGNYVMQFDSRGATSALQIICKLRGKFVEKIQIGMADSVCEDLERIDEEDIVDGTDERTGESEIIEAGEEVEK